MYDNPADYPIGARMYLNKEINKVVFDVVDTEKKTVIFFRHLSAAECRDAARVLIEYAERLEGSIL